MDQLPSKLNLLDAINEALNGPGKTDRSGVPLTRLEHFIAIARASSKKPYCVISDWQIWYVANEDDEAGRSKTPVGGHVVLYSKNVYFDEQDRVPPGYQIRSTPIARMIYSGVLESQNTVYILLGDGISKPVSPKVVNQITFESLN